MPALLLQSALLVTLTGLSVPQGRPTDPWLQFWSRIRHASTEQLTHLQDPNPGLASDDAELARYVVRFLVARARGRDNDAVAVEQRLGDFARTHPADPWAWFFLGFARASMAGTGRISKEGPLQPVGATYAEGAWSATNRALALDSGHFQAALQLFELLPGRTPEDSSNVLSIITRLLDTAGEPDQGLLLARLELAASAGDLGTMERMYRRLTALSGLWEPRITIAPIALLQARYHQGAGRFAAADSLLRIYLGAGGDSAVFFFELSISHFARGAADSGAAAYYHGAALIRDSVARALYRGDLALVEVDSELTRFDALPSTEVAGWIRAFWHQRDLVEGRTIGSRLAEHRRRVQYSRDHYARPPGVAVQRWQWNLRETAPSDPDPHPAPLEVEVEEVLQAFTYFSTPASYAPDAVFDDRGLIYIRHGEPDRRANHPGQASRHSESWMYRRQGEPLVLHFHTPTFNPPDFRLVDHWVGDLMTACQVDAQYCVVAGNRSTGIRMTRDQVERMRERERIRISRARSTDAFPLDFTRELEGVARMYALPGASGKANLLTTLLITLPTATTTCCRYIARLTLGYPEPGTIVQRDTLIDLANHPSSQSGRILAIFPLEVEPGAARLSITLRDSAGGAGLVGRAQATVIPSFTRSPELSDIILAPAGAARFRYRGLDIPIDPRHVFSRGDSMSVFFMITGLSPATSFTTTMEIRRENRRVLSLDFSETATTEQEPRMRSLALKDVRPGMNELVITITDRGTGRSITRTQQFTVSR